ncbi:MULTISPECIES: hypothetical protein [unclassified Ruegeria]|uniref:hypothetical protein n=1 Tax=unclassified Ruegeria TaxID=2625375 RepID=UPI0014896E2D|nr:MULTISPECIES: hypothetical protein [unclassified Ruegeria]NOD62914.1 hypothetical protein [Ruegeria sp. HKCCD6109]
MKRFLLTIAALAFAQTAAAETVTYVCKMTKQDAHGWIAPEYGFKIDTAQASAQAASSYQEWEAAQFKDRGAKGYRVVWNLDQTMAAGGNVRVRYQANLKPSDKSVTVRMAFLHGNFANKPFGVGTCSVQS